MRLKRFLIGEDLQNNGLKSFNRQLPYREHLTVGENVEVSHDDLPDVIDTRNIDEGGFDKTRHSKCVDPSYDLSFGGCTCSLRLCQLERIQVLKDSDSELRKCTDQFSYRLIVKEKSAGEERIKRILQYVEVCDELLL